FLLITFNGSVSYSRIVGHRCAFSSLERSVDLERRSQMIIELEGLGKRGLALDCIESLRAMQKRDTEKLALLLEAWVEAHERQLVCDTMDDDA
ncbi:hypothetical protein Tco_0158289, partial [Tanacetum coccineum]